VNAASFPQIRDYGIIGDCRAAALISRTGAIDWLCWPRFDKAAIFAALLDREKGGFWRISPAEAVLVERRYLPDSNAGNDFCGQERVRGSDRSHADRA
jgi:GH15 family glucan-1,4-alpha-glucosidase